LVREHVDEQNSQDVAGRVKQEDGKRTFETARYIEITRNTVKFSSSVYQFRNIAGFNAGKIPKSPFPLQLVLALTVGGLLVMIIGGAFSPGLSLVGILSILGACILIFMHFNQTPLYGLTLFLNSGQERVFISDDRKFLIKIVSTLYKFMEEPVGGAVYIDMSNRSISVSGNFEGRAITGDENTVY